MPARLSAESEAQIPGTSTSCCQEKRKREKSQVCVSGLHVQQRSRVSTRGGEQVAEEVLEVDEELMQVLRENRILEC